jgi:hypothetical protein
MKIRRIIGIAQAPIMSKTGIWLLYLLRIMLIATSEEVHRQIHNKSTLG